MRGIGYAYDIPLENSKFVPTQARDQIALTHRRTDAPCRLHQQPVPGLMAEGVVDRLEAVEIQHVRGEAVLRPPAVGAAVLQPFGR